MVWSPTGVSDASKWAMSPSLKFLRFSNCNTHSKYSYTPNNNLQHKLTVTGHWYVKLMNLLEPKSKQIAHNPIHFTCARLEIFTVVLPTNYVFWNVTLCKLGKWFLILQVFILHSASRIKQPKSNSPICKHHSTISQDLNVSKNWELLHGPMRKKS